MVRWWVLVHYGPDGAQSIFHVGIGDWLKANEWNHTRFHLLSPSQSVYSSIHPSIHPSIHLSHRHYTHACYGYVLNATASIYPLL
jgi:hypothetical protein